MKINSSIYKVKKPNGNIGFITPAAIGATASLVSAAKGGSRKRGGARPVSPLSESGATTINPAFQQSFTPQFSPTMQQQQDSPGASQAASPVQRADSRQSASPATGRNVYPAPPAPPMLPSPYSEPSFKAPVFQNRDGGYNNIIIVGLIVAGGIVVAKMFTDKRGGNSNGNTARRSRSRNRSRNSNRG